MVCEPDLIAIGEAMYMKYNVINSGWYTMGRDYLLNETGESFPIFDLQPYLQLLRSPHFGLANNRKLYYISLINLKNIFITYFYTQAC